MKNDFTELLDLLDEDDDTQDETSVSVTDDADKEWTIVSALDRVVTGARNSGLNKKFWVQYTDEFEFLCKELEMSPKEIVIIGILAEKEDALSWRSFAQYLGLSRLKVMGLAAEVNELKNKEWVRSYKVATWHDTTAGFRLSPGVVEAISNNQKYVPEELGGLSEEVFIDRLARFFATEGSENNWPLEDKLLWLDDFCNLNKQLPLCSTYYNLTEQASKILLLLAVNDYVTYGGTSREGLVITEIKAWVEGIERGWVLNELKDGNQELFEKELLEFGMDDGMVDNGRWKLTLKAREELMASFVPKHMCGKTSKKTTDRNLRSYKNIIEKELFYNPEELGQITRIERSISKEGFTNVKARLSECGFRSGICCLLYGAPGTGKTETVLQLARKTGRDILHVDIAAVRDKYVGESEKNIKMVFERYRNLCRNREDVPILLFNEADAIFGCRFDNLRSSVEKMDNAIQNIILQEMETF